jgi:hypothetical protein
MTLLHCGMLLTDTGLCARHLELKTLPGQVDTEDKGGVLRAGSGGWGVASATTVHGGVASWGGRQADMHITAVPRLRSSDELDEGRIPGTSLPSPSLKRKVKVFLLRIIIVY